MSFTGFGPSANQNAGTSSGFSFGAKPANTGFGFGTPATTSTGLFGTTTNTLQFGQPAQQPTSGLSFSTQPQSSGFGFGNNPTTQPQTNLTFGQPAQPQTTPAFGTTAPNPGGLTFGAPQATQPSLTFGTQAPTQSIGFGTQQQPQQTAAPAFGISQPTANNPIRFGAPTTTTTTGLSFGAPTTQTGISFGTTATTQPSGLSFSTNPAAATTTTTTGLTFPSTGLNFKAPTTTTSLPTTSAPLTFAVSAPSTGFSIAAPPSTTTSSGLLGFQATKPTTTTTGFSLATTATHAGGNLGGLGTQIKTTAVTTTTNSVGLGGIDSTQNKPGSAGGRPESNAVKENQIPHEILQTIEGFKSFVKAQKSLSSDIARGSPKTLNKVAEDTEALRQLVTGVLSAGLQRNRTTAARLKADTATGLHHAEMAQRTHDTPAGLQYDNTQPLRYFQELANRFEQDMQLYRREIENTEKHIESLSQPFTLTPQELSGALKRLHASFVALAGRLQSAHTRTEAEKVRYTTLRRNILNETTDIFANDTDIFDSLRSNYGKTTPVGGTPGPTPFGSLGNPNIYGLTSQAISEQKSSNFPIVNNPQLGWGTSGTQSAAQPSLVSNTPLLGEDSSAGGFQLSKPPLGNKRGKR